MSLLSLRYLVYLASIFPLIGLGASSQEFDNSPQSVSKNAPHDLINTINQHPVTVRVGNALCTEEEAFVKARLTHANTALSTILETQVPLEDTPRVAFCGSGGGFRAMIATLGALAAFDTLGLTDTLLYSAGVSGSTWSLGCWYMYGKKPSDAIAPLREQVKLKLEHNFEILPVIERSLEGLLYQRRLGVVGVYGALLSHRFFNTLKDRYSVTLSDLALRINDGSMPMPIYTGVIPPKPSSTIPYVWVEMTPFEVGILEDSAFIPTKAFGRQFKHGVSNSTASEYPFDFCLGICGSAFCAEFDQYLDAVLKPQIPMGLFDDIEEIAISTQTGRIRLCPARLPNFTYKLDNTTYGSWKNFFCVDAGFDINIPLPAVLRLGRPVDIVIVVDASADVINAPELVKAEQYAQRHKIKFPPIDCTDITNKPISVFQDPNDPTTPMVIYIPVIKNSSYSSTFDPVSCTQTGYCKTFNLQYTNAQFDELFGLTNFTVKQQAEVIIQALKEAVARKSNVVEPSLQD